MYIMRYLLGLELLWACRDIWAPPKKVVTFYCSIRAISIRSATKGKNRVCLLLWLLLQLGEKTYGCCVSQERGCVRLCCVMSAATAAVPEGNTRVCSSYGSSSPSSLLAHASPTLGQWTVRTVWTARQLVLWIGWRAIYTVVFPVAM